MATRLRDLLPCRGPRVLLRGWRASDADAVQHWYRPGHRWHDLNGPYFADPTEEEADQMAGRIRRVAADGGPKGPLRLLPIARADDEDHLLGTVSRYAIDETNWTAAGVVVFDDANWNQGLGREALGLWIDLLFRSDPDLHRIDLRTWSGNVGMVKVAERLGFTLEARFREARMVDGERYDALGFGQLRTEWQTLSDARS